jgi:STE24 endopeptidase
MNPYVIILLVLIVGTGLLDIGLDLLSLGRIKNGTNELHAEFKNIYDAEKYKKSLDYQATNYRFDLINQLVDTPIVIAFIFLGGFNWVDQWARAQGVHAILTALLFAGMLAFLRTISQMPWSIYRTFVIEEKYGFNKTSPKTFVLDLIKGTLIGALIGGGIFAGVVYFFETVGPLAWLYSWIAFTILQLTLMYLAPVIFMPLFNQFKSLPDGELKTAIAQYNIRNKFQMSGIYTMDSSKRSTKSNAFFTGFGKFKRLVLFDTLLEKQSTDELVAIFAHEVGHFKLGHILRFTGISIASSALLFFVLSLFIGNEQLFAAFRMENVSVYASLIFVAMLYSPISRFLGLLGHRLSRKAEFEADRYSVETFGKPEVLVSALKKLSIDNLSNLDPHPLRVFFDYTHPPVLKRIEVLRQMASAPSIVRRIH